MTHDEAARPDASGEPGTPAPPPKDERPRPQYGEYAPPGWSWTPPGDEGAAADQPAAPLPQGATANRDASAEASARDDAAGLPAAPAGVRTAPSWDRFVTIALLAFGAFGAWNSAASLQQIPQQMQLSYDMMGVGTFTAPEWLPTLALVGTIVQLTLYAAVLGLSILRLRAGRLAFWIPLAGGVLSFIITMALLAIVMLNDPAYLDWVTGMSGATPTPTP